jgi:hypothetical protein
MAPVEVVQQGRDGVGGALGHRHLEPREALEDAAEHEVHEGPLAVPAHLGDHQRRGGGVASVVGVAGARVQVEGHVEILDGRPERVVGPAVERLDPLHVGGDARQQHATAEALLLDPLHVGDGVVDIVEEDLADSGALDRLSVAEVDHPAVVGADAGAAQLVLVGLGRPGEQHEPRVEGGHGVGVDDLGDDAVGELVGVTAVVVPVAHAQVGVAQVLPRVLVLTAPGVEGVAVLRVEVLAVLLVGATGMAIGRDDRVVVVS